MINWKRLIYFLPAALYCGLIFLLSSGPINIDLKFFYWDKGWHWIEFLLLGFLLSLGFFRYLPERPILGIYLTLMTGAIVAVSDEIHQLFVPGRNCDWKDWIADLTGVIAGLIIYLMIENKLKRSGNQKQPAVPDKVN